MPTDDEICACFHAMRDHVTKLSRRSTAVGTSGKLTSGICLVAGCACRSFILAEKPAPEKI